MPRPHARSDPAGFRRACACLLATRAYHAGLPMTDVDQLTGSEPRDEALPLLVDAYGGRLFGLGLRFCGDRDQAEDLVQETFLQAYRHWHRFEGRSRPSTWLFTIAARACQRFHRKRAGEPDRLEPLDEEVLGAGPMGVAHGQDDGPLAATQRAEARERIEAAITELPPEFRLPLVLKEVLGFSLAEVAGMLDLKVATVKTRLHRARLRVRAALEEALPRRDLPPAAFSRQVCLDLLAAKQAALDEGRPFALPDGLVCERCSEFFATLDLTRDLCAEIARGELPDELRAEIAQSFAREA